MSAISSTLLSLCSAGDTLILGDVVYAPPSKPWPRTCSHGSASDRGVPTQDLDAVERC